MTSDLFVGTRSGVRFSKLFPTRADPSPAHPRAAELRRWFQEHLSRPHRDLGRSGPVCPFVGPAMAHEALWVTFLDGTSVDVDQIAAVVDDMYDQFAAMPPHQEPDSRLKAILAVFSDVTDYHRIDTVHQDRKNRFIPDGLMLGQFYPGCRVSGLRNPRFPALDSPIPLLVVRHMVPSDFPFLAPESRWITTYLTRFAPNIPGTVRSTMAEKLVQPVNTIDTAPERPTCPHTD